MDLLNNIMSNGTFSNEAIIIALVTSILLGFIIAFVYSKISNYTKNFIITLAILPILVQVIIMLVNGNLGTGVAILGAFSLVRFRSIPGTSREIVTVFFAMVVGLSIGTGFVLLSVILTVVVCLLMIVFSKTKFGNVNSHERRLRIMVAEDIDYTSVFSDIFKKYTNKANLIKVKTVNMGSLFQIDYNVTLKNNINEKEFIDELRILNGNLKIIMGQLITDEEL